MERTKIKGCFFSEFVLVAIVMDTMFCLKLLEYLWVQGYNINVTTTKALSYGAILLEHIIPLDLQSKKDVFTKKIIEKNGG